MSALASFVERFSTPNSPGSNGDFTVAGAAGSKVAFLDPKTMSFSTVGVAGGAAVQVIDSVAGLSALAVLIVAAVLAAFAVVAFVIFDRAAHPENFRNGRVGLYLLAALLNGVLLFGCVLGIGGL